MSNAIYERTTRNGKGIDTHRAVMQDHIGRTLGRYEFVHHINGDKRDNRIENLQIMTPAEHNRLHLLKHPLTKKCKVCGKEFVPTLKHRARDLVCSRKCMYLSISQQVSQYDLDGKHIATYSSIREAATAIGGKANSITCCLLGRAKTYMGYKWKREKVDELVEELKD